MSENRWQSKTLGDVCEFQRGLTYAKSDEVDLSDNVVLRATNIDLNTNLLKFDELRYIRDTFDVPAAKKVKLGSLMVCTASGSKSHLGKIAYIDQDYGYAFGGFMGMITPTDAIFPRYLFHLMTSGDYKDFIDGLSDGANINNLKFDDLKRFPFPVPPLAEMQRLISAEQSDLFDVLAYVAYLLPPVTRAVRAELAKRAIAERFNDRQRAFLEFVLGQYVTVGVDELGSEKLSPLLRLKYHNAIADAVADLGPPNEISRVFTGFQQFLYQPSDAR